MLECLLSYSLAAALPWCEYPGGQWPLVLARQMTPLLESSFYLSEMGFLIPPFSVLALLSGTTHLSARRFRRSSLCFHLLNPSLSSLDLTSPAAVAGI